MTELVHAHIGNVSMTKFENNAWEKLDTKLASKRHGHNAIWLEDELMIIGGQSMAKFLVYLCNYPLELSPRVSWQHFCLFMQYREQS